MSVTKLFISGYDHKNQIERNTKPMIENPISFYAAVISNKKSPRIHKSTNNRLHERLINPFLIALCILNVIEIKKRCNSFNI